MFQFRIRNINLIFSCVKLIKIKATFLVINWLYDEATICSSDIQALVQKQEMNDKLFMKAQLVKYENIRIHKARNYETSFDQDLFCFATETFEFMAT